MMPNTHPGVKRTHSERGDAGNMIVGKCSASSSGFLSESLFDIIPESCSPCPGFPTQGAVRVPARQPNAGEPAPDTLDSDGSLWGVIGSGEFYGGKCGELTVVGVLRVVKACCAHHNYASFCYGTAAGSGKPQTGDSN